VSVGVGKMSNSIPSRIKLGEGLIGRVWQTGQRLLRDDCRIGLPSPSNTRREELEAMVGVPLKSDSLVIGVLGLATAEEGRQIADSEVEALNHLAQLASVAWTMPRCIGPCGRAWLIGSEQRKPCENRRKSIDCCSRGAPPDVGI